MTLLIARLLLAGVFLVAGAAKLRDRDGSQRAVVEFGLPSALAAPLGLLLPLAELAVAATLIPTSVNYTPPRPAGRRWGATPCSPPWLSLFCGRVSTAPGRARLPGSGLSRVPSSRSSSEG